MRVMLTVPLRVSGKTEIGERFSVRAMSHTVSLHGASVELEQGVVLDEILQLENEITGEKVEGKVVSIRRARDPSTPAVVVSRSAKGPASSSAAML